MTKNLANRRDTCQPPAAIFDDGYLERLRAGDEDTAQHFDRYFRKLIRIKLWRAFDPQTQADLIDDVISTSVERIMKGEPRNAAYLPGYVCGICSNLVKRRCRPQIFVDDQTFSLSRIRDRRETAEVSLIEEERAAAVRLVLNDLRVRDRAILVDLFFEELHRDEVCKKHGLTRDQLRMVLFYARGRFQREWEKRKWPVKLTKGEKAWHFSTA